MILTKLLILISIVMIGVTGYDLNINAGLLKVYLKIKMTIIRI